MKTIILCGGIGTRLKEETEFKPKPMVLIGGKPMLWHIMKIYKNTGHNEFIIALGYKGEMIKDYFKQSEFNITFIDTGQESETGERLSRVKDYVGDEFMVTYGDGVSDIDINKLVEFHRKQGTIGTITGVHPYSRYGLVRVEGNLATNFEQKPLMFDFINGGFMVFNRKAFDYFDNGIMENGLIKLAKEKQLSVYKYEGFWKSMDTYREMEELNKLWQTTKPWGNFIKEKES